MKVYWDTSAIINAVVSKAVFDRLDTESHFSRVHALSEFFSTMTGRGIIIRDANRLPTRFTMSPKDAALWLRKFGGRVTLVELGGQAVLDALDQATTKGVMGARVYDYGHSLAADQAKADVILTRNTTDFRGLSASAQLQWP